MSAVPENLRGRLFCDVVPDGVDLLRMSERNLRRQLEPGGALQHLAFRPSPRRCLIKVSALLALAGVSPDMDEDPAPTGSIATTTDELSGARDADQRPTLRAIKHG